MSLLFPQEGALIFGENGAGKTNILEAIYFLCVGRSQRGAAKKDMIHIDANESYIEGHFNNFNDSSQVSLSLGFSRNRKLAMKKNGAKVKLLSELILDNNIVSFSSQDSLLIYGDPLERRKYMDILLSQTDPTYFENLVNYKKNLINRNILLNLSHTDTSISIYEEKMAEHGSYIIRSRSELFSFISPRFSQYFSKINSNTKNGTVKYSPSVHCNTDSGIEFHNRIRKRLKDGRNKDCAHGFTSIGPHRDDFKCYLDDYQAKSFGSQGQCRSMALSLRLCALDFLESKKEGTIIILVDDAFSELDSNSTINMYSILNNRGQLFITALSKKSVLYSDLQTFLVKENSVTKL